MSRLEQLEQVLREIVDYEVMSDEYAYLDALALQDMARAVIQERGDSDE